MCYTDGQQFTLGPEGGLQTVPRAKRAEVAEQLAALKKLAEDALGNP